MPLGASQHPNYNVRTAATLEFDIQNMQEMAENSVFRECFKCKYKGVTAETKCPQCGRKLYGPKEIRTRGIIQVVSGLFLVVFMGAIAIFVGAMLVGASKDPSSAKRVQEAAGTLLIIYAIFGLVIVFGLHGLIMGLWQIVTGRRNQLLIWIMWGLLLLLLFAGGVFMGISR